MPRPITFTLDVEDHRPDDRAWTARYEVDTVRVLDWLADHGVRATVFFVGRVAERSPHLVTEAVERGHEVALHNWDHVRLTVLDPATLAEWTRRGRAVLEDLAGHEVRGFRAPTGSLVPYSSWALDVLAEAGITYSSSTCPGRTFPTAFPGIPDRPFRWSNGLAEFPAPTAGLGPLRIPYLGGTTLRLLPKPALALLRRVAPDPGTDYLYCHPYDFDDGEPFWWVPDVGMLSPLLWVGRRGLRDKLEGLVAGGTAPPLGEQLELADRGGTYAPGPSGARPVAAARR